MKFGTRVRLKSSNYRGEFELDLAKSKTNIAENSFALGHETHNTHTFDCFSYFVQFNIVSLYKQYILRM